jgi:hypothetical protein
MIKNEIFRERLCSQIFFHVCRTFAALVNMAERSLNVQEICRTFFDVRASALGAFVDSIISTINRSFCFNFWRIA